MQIFKEAAPCIAFPCAKLSLRNVFSEFRLQEQEAEYKLLEMRT